MKNRIDRKISDSMFISGQDELLLAVNSDTLLEPGSGLLWLEEEEQQLFDILSQLKVDQPKACSFISKVGQIVMEAAFRMDSAPWRKLTDNTSPLTPAQDIKKLQNALQHLIEVKIALSDLGPWGKSELNTSGEYLHVVRAIDGCKFALEELSNRPEQNCFDGRKRWEKNTKTRFVTRTALLFEETFGRIPPTTKNSPFSKLLSFLVHGTGLSDVSNWYPYIKDARLIMGEAPNIYLVQFGQGLPECEINQQSAKLGISPLTE